MVLKCLKLLNYLKIQEKVIILDLVEWKFMVMPLEVDGSFDNQ